MKKWLVFLIAFSILAVLAGTFAAAQYETVSNSIKTAMGSIVGILGGTVEALIAIPYKILYFLVLVLVLNMAARTAFRNKTVSIVIAVLVSALGIQALPANWLQVFLATYGTLAAVVLIFVPVVILYLFSRRMINTPLFTPIWVTAGVVFLFLALNYGFGLQEFSQPIYGGIALLAAAISLIVVMNKKWLQKARRRQMLIDREYKTEELQRIQHELDHPTAGSDITHLQERKKEVKVDIQEIDRELSGHL